MPEKDILTYAEDILAAKPKAGQKGLRRELNVIMNANEEVEQRFKLDPVNYVLLDYNLQAAEAEGIKPVNRSIRRKIGEIFTNILVIGKQVSKLSERQYDELLKWALRTIQGGTRSNITADKMSRQVRRSIEKAVNPHNFDDNSEDDQPADREERFKKLILPTIHETRFFHPILSRERAIVYQDHAGIGYFEDKEGKSIVSEKSVLLEKSEEVALPSEERLRDYILGAFISNTHVHNLISSGGKVEVNNTAIPIIMLLSEVIYSAIEILYTRRNPTHLLPVITRLAIKLVIGKRVGKRPVKVLNSIQGNARNYLQDPILARAVKKCLKKLGGPDME